MCSSDCKYRINKNHIIVDYHCDVIVSVFKADKSIGLGVLKVEWIGNKESDSPAIAICMLSLLRIQ